MACTTTEVFSFFHMKKITVLCWPFRCLVIIDQRAAVVHISIYINKITQQKEIEERNKIWQLVWHGFCCQLNHALSTDWMMFWFVNQVNV